ncbi:MAG: YceI family protein [Candidatus Obscuribacterales bacterium]|nr:YceI family protein [Candidatus Obscuribacterales bacterium]
MKHAQLFALPLITSVCFSLAAGAEEPVWKIQPDTSNIKWKISNLGLNTSGTFSNITGDVIYSGAAEGLSSAHVIAKVPVVSLNTKNDMRDKHLKSKDFFNVKEFPLAEFRSTEVKETKNGHFQIVGTLLLHGVNQSVTLEADPLKTTKDKAGKQHLSTTAIGKVNRKTAGIGGFTAATMSAEAKIEVTIDMIKG